MDSPELLAAVRDERVWFGEFDGKSVRFSGIPKGRYILDAKVVGESSNALREAPTLAHGRRTVEIQASAALDLGVLELEAK